MRKFLLTSAFALLPLAAQAADSTLGITLPAGATNMSGVTNGGVSMFKHVLSNPTTPTQSLLIDALGQAPVIAADGQLVTLGAKSDTASGGAGATLMAMQHQALVSLAAGSAAPGATSASAAAIQGAVATAGAQTSSPLPDGCRAATAEPTAVADGQAVLIRCTKTGADVTVPWTVPELYMRGKATVVITVPATLLAASGVASQFTYLTSMQCGNSSATGVWVTLSDSNATPIYVPPTGGNNPIFTPPLVSSALNTSITVVGDSTQTTVRCGATGYRGL